MSIAAIRSSRGDEYQLCIALHWLIKLLSDDTVKWVQTESMVLPDQEELVKVDDVVIAYKDGGYLYIQAKVNQPNHRAWSLSDKVLKEELIKAYQQMKNDAQGKIRFYSQTPFGKIKTLIDNCSIYETYFNFAKNTDKSSDNTLTNLAKIIENSREEAYELCKHISVGPHHSIEGWDEENHNSLKRLVSEPENALLVLEKMLRNQQSRLRDTELRISSEDIESEFEKKGIFRAPWYAEAEIIKMFKKASQIGRQSIRTIGGEKLERPELQQLFNLLEKEEESILLTDQPGSGKTWFLLELADLIEEKSEWSMLFIKGELFDDADSEESLYQKGMPKDIVGLAARLSSYQKVIIIIDSLDVLSLSRDHAALKVFLSLMDRLEKIPHVTIVAACRNFDLAYDPLLRDRKWGEKITISHMSFEKTVAPLLEKWGIHRENVSDEQRKLLTIPQNLKLFERLVNKVSLESLTSSYQLQEAFLDEIIIRNPKLGNIAMIVLQQMATTLISKRKSSLSKAVFKAEEQIFKG